MKSARTTLIWLIILILILPLLAYGKSDKFKIKSVSFTGNHAYTDKRLRRVILSQPSILFNPVYYYEDIFKDDLSALELFYRNNGFLDAKVEDYSVRLDSVKYRAFIKIRILEGELTRVDGISIFDNVVFSDSDLMRLIPLEPGDRLRRDGIDNGTLAMLTHYAEHGYLDATVVPEVRVDSLTHLALIDYFVTEGLQYSIDTILYSGLVRTQKKVVHRELNFKTGEIVNYSRLLESQKNLYLSGLFESAFIRPVAPMSGEFAKKDILIELKENKRREYNFSFGFGTVDKVRLGIGLFNINWRGSGQKLGFTGKLSFIEASTEASFTEPWTFNTHWRTDAALSASYLIEPAYDARTIGGRLTIGRSLGKKFSTNITYRHQNVTLTNVKAALVPDEVRSQIRSLKLTFSRESRDNLFNPASGSYLEQSIETAGLFYGASESFTRIILIGKYFKTVAVGTVMGTGLELAWMESPRGFNSILLSERLYAGGPSSLRAFRYKHVGPLDANGYPIGGGFRAVWNMIEARRPIYKIIDGAAFLDVGNVWSSIEKATIGDIRWSPGIGIRINTSFGLFRTDYGFNIEPRDSEPSGMFYFSVGHAF